MSIFNRRNAVIGWGVWQVAKRTAKVKAKGSPLPARSGRKTGSKTKPVVAATFAGVVGAVAFWRKRRASASS
ncbi:MAG TPA: hypothetical protein VMG74_00075 [Gaiellaceae bacterium]|nr:hypothetical protein [Gaiellaceae bacterium]